MLKKIALYVLVPIGIIMCIYVAYSRWFRPVIFARAVSELDIPINAKVVEFREQWGEFNGNGYALSKLNVDDAELRNIVKQCQFNNYQVLPVDQAQLSYSDENIDDLISKNDNGFYRPIFLKDQFSIIIVNTKQRTITAYTSVFWRSLFI